MCSRFEMTAGAGDLAQRFSLTTPPPLPNAPEFRPTDLALVITPGGAGLLDWGLSAGWDAKPLINARAETLNQKKTFLPLLESRCLVPATVYFEWRKGAGGRHKNRIGLADGSLFAFAGLTDGERFTIVTCRSSPAIAHIHDRMPVILTAEAEARWIDPGVPFADVAGMLVPYETEPLKTEEETPPPAKQPDLFG